MVSFFFYENLTNPDIIKKISDSYCAENAYIIIESYDKTTMTLKLGNEKKLVMLHGKLVSFNMKFEDVIKKINSIEECKFEKNSYTLDTIYASKMTGGLVKEHIIF